MGQDHKDGAARLPKYYVRFSCKNDFNKLMQFYKDHHHASVVARTGNLVEQLTTNGSVVMIEDEQNNIVAASISYPLRAANDDHGDTRWTEIGSTRIAMGGYSGFFNAMIAAQVLRTFLVEPPSERMVAEMKDPPVQALARNLGWRPYTNPPPAMVKISYNILQDKATEGYSNWFQQGVEGLPIMARFMKDALDNPVLTHRKTGAQIELSFERCKLTSIFRDAINQAAQLPPGDIESPDMKRSMAKARQKWLRSL